MNGYGILINTKDSKFGLYEIPEGFDFRDIYDLIGVHYFEIAHPIQGTDLYIDEEGLINGSVDEIGVFQLKDADGEILGQTMYAGNGLLLKSVWGDEGAESNGFTKEEAMRIYNSLIVRMGSPYEIAILGI